MLSIFLFAPSFAPAAPFSHLSLCCFTTTTHLIFPLTRSPVSSRLVSLPLHSQHTLPLKRKHFFVCCLSEATKSRLSLALDHFFLLSLPAHCRSEYLSLLSLVDPNSSLVLACSEGPHHQTPLRPTPIVRSANLLSSYVSLTRATSLANLAPAPIIFTRLQTHTQLLPVALIQKLATALPS